MRLAQRDRSILIAATTACAVLLPCAAIALDIAYVDCFQLGGDGFERASLQARSRGLDAYVFLPVKFILLSSAYEYRSMEWDGSSADLDRKALPDQLQMTMLSLGGLWDVSARWKMLARVDPGIASDFKDISLEDWFFRAYLIALYSHSKEFSLILGGGYTDQFEFGNPLPIIGFDWRPSRDAQFSLTIPDRFHFRWAANDRFWPGLRGILRGYSFRLSESKPYDHSRVHRRELRFGPILDVRLVDDLFINVEGGWIALNEFDVYDRAERRILKGDRNSNWYVQAGLAYRFDISRLDK